MIVKVIDRCETYLYCADIRDKDSGKCFIPDYECYLHAGVDTDGTVEIFNVFVENGDLKGDFFSLDDSCDDRSKSIAADIREQAQNDDNFCDEVREKQGFEYPEDEYVRQHRIRASDVLPGRTF